MTTLESIEARLASIRQRIKLLGLRLEEINGDEFALAEWHRERREVQAELDAIDLGEG